MWLPAEEERYLSDVGPVEVAQALISQVAGPAYSFRSGKFHRLSAPHTAMRIDRLTGMTKE